MNPGQIQSCYVTPFHSRFILYEFPSHLLGFSSSRAVTVQVGNGGFCLRRIQACLALMDEFPETRTQYLEYGEDLFYAVAGAQSLHFKIPNERVASTFSLEMLPEWYFKANGGRFVFDRPSVSLFGAIVCRIYPFVQNTDLPYRAYLFVASVRFSLSFSNIPPAISLSINFQSVSR